MNQIKSLEWKTLTEVITYLPASQQNPESAPTDGSNCIVWIQIQIAPKFQGGKYLNTELLVGTVSLICLSRS